MKKRPPPFKKPKQSSGRGLGPLTKHLRALAAEIETTDNSFNLITRAEMLAMVVWKKALGWIEPAKKQGEVVLVKEVIHKPESWAIQLIYERLEGKAPQATPDEKGRLTAAEKVTELVRTKLNAEAESVLSLPSPGGPVDLPNNRVESPQESDAES